MKAKFERDVRRDAIMTDAAMRDAKLGYEYWLPLAGMHCGLTPDEALVHYPKWAATWPIEYRREVSALLAQAEDIEKDLD